MSLPTAPCTHCRARIVYGQRRCPACGTTFDYGPTPPPEPTAAQIQQALLEAEIQAQLEAQSGPQPVAPAAPVSQAAPVAPVSVPEGAPVLDEGFVDRGRYDELSTAPVETEAIPGFVDSTLFKAFTPDVVEIERVEGLEHTASAPVGAVPTEAIPGFVDSTLFKAFTPDVVETERVEGLEASFSAATRPRPRRERAESADGPAPCRDCGTQHDRALCPACGARR